MKHQPYQDGVGVERSLGQLGEKPQLYRTEQPLGRHETEGNLLDPIRSGV